MSPLFLAIDIPSEVKKALTALCYGIPETNWILEEKFHITLRYLGELSDHLRLDLQESLHEIEMKKFSIKLKGLGHFSKKHGGVIWVGIENDENLQNLRKKTDRLLSGNNIPKDRASYIPHASIGYYKKRYAFEVADHLKQHQLFQSDSFSVDHFSLYESHRGSKGSHYYKLESYLLRK
ncbi:RNA 2',3'-cyclic phosphodiesterase [Chlamydiales bacterium SCGC AG-110-M15]|nr:RNA 2',3'-cyclic phosphodiesterase [Chlamydiales bacterium SCGC AG-110-M15]